MYHTMSIETLKTLADEKRTKGYRILVDGESLRYRTANLASKAIGEIYTPLPPRISRNMLGELLINFDY